MFEFIHRYRKQTDNRDYKIEAKLYLIKSMQKDVFEKEFKLFERSP